MSTTSIFSFDHGQKEMSKAIGVEASYLDDLQEQISDVLKEYLFDKERNIRSDTSPSMLVETCLHEFSYNQLVILASFFLNSKINDFGKMIEKKLGNTIKTISLDSDDIPDHIREILQKLAKEGKGGKASSALDTNDLPQEVKDFLDTLVRKSEDDGDDD
jgi:hypothetical protein